MSQRPKGHHFIGCSAYVMVREDLVAFEHALRDAFPTIRFLNGNYDDAVDREETAKLRQAYEDRGIDVGSVQQLNPDCVIPSMPKPRSEWKVPYIDGFSSRRWHGLLSAWVVDEGWEPRWTLMTSFRPFVRNEPGRRFHVSSPHFSSDQQSGPFYEPPERISEDEMIVGSVASWHGGYYDDEPEQKKFLSAVRRIFFRLTTNQYVAVDLASGAITARSDKGGSFRFGWRALAWSASHRNNFLYHRMKPFDWDPALNTAPRTIEMAAKLPKF